MAPKSTWTHLARFEHKGVPTFGQLVSPHPDGDLEEQFEVYVATGDPVFDNIKVTDEKVTVTKSKLLAPFATVPIVQNCGLNYNAHVEESIFFSSPDLHPPRPYIFFRPANSIAPPYPTYLRVYKVQQECLDYEGEMVFQTGGRPLKNITPEEAEKEIVGFCVGCDFSPRPGKYLGTMNYIWSKAFDDWTPAGPVLVHPSVVGVIPELDLITRWNGKVVQSDNTKNMTYNVAKVLSAMSTGTTIEPGTVVFSGTCGGGAWFRSQGKAGTGINDGDEIEVQIKGLGSIKAYPKFDDGWGISPLSARESL